MDSNDIFAYIAKRCSDYFLTNTSAFPRLLTYPLNHEDTHAVLRVERKPYHVSAECRVSLFDCKELSNIDVTAVLARDIHYLQQNVVTLLQGIDKKIGNVGIFENRFICVSPAMSKRKDYVLEFSINLDDTFTAIHLSNTVDKILALTLAPKREYQ